MAIMIFLFAFSSIVGNYYYGEINVPFFGKNSELWLKLFRIGVVLMVIFGSLAELNLVWNLADIFMGFLCLTNLYAVLRLSGYARMALKDYMAQKAKGVQEPVFTPDVIGTTDGIHAWGVDKKN